MVILSNIFEFIVKIKILPVVGTAFSLCDEFRMYVHTLSTYKVDGTQLPVLINNISYRICMSPYVASTA
jgi:hypothetical protein